MPTPHPPTPAAPATGRRAVRAAIACVVAAVLVACSGSAPQGPQATVSAPSGSAPSPSTAVAEEALRCAVEYTVTNEWPGGFQAEVALTVLDSPVTSWTLGWSFADGQTVTQVWDATVAQVSAAVTMTAVEHNGVLAAGGSTSFGFIGTWQGANTVPTDFTLDASPCAGPADGQAGGADTPPAVGSSPSAPPASGGASPVAPGGAAGGHSTGSVFYTSPTTQAAAAAQAATGETRRLLDKIALTPQALWVGSWSSADQARASVADHTGKAAAAGQIPLVVIYAIPGRDCGNHSAGGVATSEYAAWIDTVAAGITSTTWIVLEPDALAQLGDCDGQGDRVAYLKYAAEKLSQGGAQVYIDAGHAAWLAPAEAARRLALIGFDHAVGFALNTSNYQTTAASRAYGEQVSALVGGRPFVVDTSRNGTGPLGTEWCNPSGRGLGDQPRVVADGTHLAGLVWVKAPGESDGSCNGGPGAGQWWQDGALELARNASW